MTDAEAKQLLTLLFNYVTNTHPDHNMTICDLADDCADSQGFIDPECNSMRDQIYSLVLDS